MNNQKKLSISLLNEMLLTANHTRQYAEYKLRYLIPCSPNSFRDISEFEKTKQQAISKIVNIQDCIDWINSLENENES